MKRDKEKPEGEIWAYLGLGWIIALYLTAFTLGGIFLDTRFHTSPLFLLLGVLLAFISCGYEIYKVVKKLTEREEKKTKGQSGP